MVLVVGLGGLGHTVPSRGLRLVLHHVLGCSGEQGDTWGSAMQGFG